MTITTLQYQFYYVRNNISSLKTKLWHRKNWDNFERGREAINNNARTAAIRSNCFRKKCIPIFFLKMIQVFKGIFVICNHHVTH